jgi:rhodanese-related sulfurtransferase
LSILPIATSRQDPQTHRHERSRTMTVLTVTETSTDLKAANPSDAAAHFESLLRFETDCYDVHTALKTGNPGFVVLDVRSPQLYAEGHVPGAESLPHGKINDRNLERFSADTVFVVYCSGPHCNGADRAALRLSRLGRRVKKMIGGIHGWKIEGFALASASK